MIASIDRIGRIARTGGPEGDDDERVALIARTLQISADVWRATLAHYERLAPPAADASVPGRLEAFARAYAPHSPHATPPAAPTPPRDCPACGARAMGPLLGRRLGTIGPPLVYGRCALCAHGMVLEGAAPADEPYRDARYYASRDQRGIGYDDYGQEAAYREAKGARLVAQVAAIADAPFARLLEVGSGFGFTRAASERRGLRTGGVDVNPHACAEASRRYGLTTFAGTLAQALAAPDSGMTAGTWDAVLYQFVLEHLPDPAAELRDAATALRPGGTLALLVPSMEAVEIDVFGASYRSFRADHLHLFSRASLDHLLAHAGFERRWAETWCNLHLLGDVLTEAELAALYTSGRGPDLFVVARKTS